ncbi:hypothetical protein MBLNU230_g1900t1 [Neophaeotheca triangularis]
MAFYKLSSADSAMASRWNNFSAQQRSNNPNNRETSAPVDFFGSAPDPVVKIRKTKSSAPATALSEKPQSKPIVMHKARKTFSNEVDPAAIVASKNLQGSPPIGMSTARRYSIAEIKSLNPLNSLGPAAHSEYVANRQPTTQAQTNTGGNNMVAEIGMTRDQDSDSKALKVEIKKEVANFGEVGMLKKAVETGDELGSESDWVAVDVTDTDDWVTEI